MFMLQRYIMFLQQYLSFTGLQAAWNQYLLQFRARTYPSTFTEEINEQCRIFFHIYALPFAFVALPYSALDAQLMPHEPLIVWFRYGMSVVVVCAIAARRWWSYQQRHTVITMAMMSYLIIVSGIITGLAKAHPSYFGGYCYIIVLMGALPVMPSQLMLSLAVSLVCFVGLALQAQVNFAEPTVRYGMQDLMSSVLVNVFMSFGWTILRRTSYEQGRRLQEQTRILEQQATELIMLNNDKNEILNIVAHDLKNPIGAVRGLAEVLRYETDKADGEDEARQTVTRVNRTC
jgi:hypothetical protein